MIYPLWCCRFVVCQSHGGLHTSGHAEPSPPHTLCTPGTAHPPWTLPWSSGTHTHTCTKHWVRYTLSAQVCYLHICSWNVLSLFKVSLGGLPFLFLFPFLAPLTGPGLEGSCRDWVVAKQLLLCGHGVWAFGLFYILDEKFLLHRWTWRCSQLLSNPLTYSLVHLLFTCNKHFWVYVYTHTLTDAAHLHVVTHTDTFISLSA